MAERSSNDSASPPTHTKMFPNARNRGFFANAANFVINNSLFNDVVDSAMDALQHRVIPGVEYDSRGRAPPPRCHPGTRIDLLETMATWRDDAQRVGNIFWVTGPVGSGKTAIAQTFAEDCDRIGCLGATLFFSRAYQHDDVYHVIPTIANQLAKRSFPYKRLLTTLLKSQLSAIEASLSAQFTKLIEDPIRELQSQGMFDPASPLVILLDGLDECRDRIAQVELMGIIDDHIRSHGKTSPFLWVVYSRPERHLRRVLEKLQEDCRTSSCQHTELDINDTRSAEDVALVLHDGFSYIRKRYGIREWPTDAQLQRILQATSGFFSFASDILNFVQDPMHADPVVQLTICINFLDNPHLSGKIYPFKSLDRLYMQILSNIHEFTLPTTLVILLFCVSKPGESCTAQTIQTTFNISPFTFYSALQDLHSVLYIPPPEKADSECLRFYHPSFPEFLRDPARSAQFTIEKVAQEIGGLGRNAATTRMDGVTETSETEAEETRYSDISEIFWDNTVAGTGLVSSGPSQHHRTRQISEAYARLLRRLSHVLEVPESRKALSNLGDDRAQLMVDFLYSVLLEPSFPTPWLRKHTLIALYKLSKASLVYPHCYILKDITFDSHEGGGTFSDVHKGRHGEQHLCLKVIRLHQKSDTEAMLKIYAKEAILWGQLHHPHIVPFYGIYYLNEARKQVCLVSPWMRNGNLVDYLKNNSSTSRIIFIDDVVSGLEYLHNQNLIHGDIKGMNILVDDAERACITDFGLSFIRTDQTLAYTMAGSTAQGLSYRWAAPELLEDGVSSTSASDIWAFGCTCYEVITGLLPFQGLTDPQVFRKLMKGELPARLPLASGSGGAENVIWELIDRCWKLEPADRPTCQEISQELRRKGLAREQAQSTLDVIPQRQAFLDAMRKNEEVQIDLNQVELILNKFITEAVL